MNNKFELDSLLKNRDFCEALELPVKTDLVFEPLGQGEYNINYWFTHPLTNKKLVLRITTGSQMGFKNQITYEYKALELLNKSGRTPASIYVDDTKSIIPYGYLVMDYLPGNPLDYKSDLKIAAHILADIHNLDVPDNNHLIKPDNPLKAILDECNDMFQIYIDSNLASAEVRNKVQYLLKYAKNILHSNSIDSKRCIINTELNSGNFLINGDGNNNYLVDWEKPLYACLQQDLGHFLAPTTTFWKTDTFLNQEAIYSFINEYCRHSKTYKDADILWQSTLPYFAITCMRGITWCAMAWVQYQSPEKLIRNEFTYKKIKSYLELEFLEMIRKNYLEG